MRFHCANGHLEELRICAPWRERCSRGIKYSRTWLLRTLTTAHHWRNFRIAIYEKEDVTGNKAGKQQTSPQV